MRSLGTYADDVDDPAVRLPLQEEIPGRACPQLLASLERANTGLWCLVNSNRYAISLL
jgi:hypothetical protein